MKSVGKNILAVIAGLVVGSLVNIVLVNIGPSVVPLPEGADISTMENLRDSMKTFTAAHALGTLVGAFIAAKFAASHYVKFAMCIGVFFLMGGITAISMLGGPLWFNFADLLLAYIPMSLLGATLAGRIRS